MKMLDWLQLALAVFRLLGIIDWPWWQVMLPYILIFGVPAFIMIIGLFLILADDALSWIYDQLF